MPEEATVDEVEQLHIDVVAARGQGGRRLPRQLQGRPAAVDAKKDGAPAAGGRQAAGDQVVERIVERIVARAGPRAAAAHAAVDDLRVPVADCKGFVTVGEYDDGRPGELFIRVSKQGSTLAGIMDAFAISVSHGLQYGVPLRASWRRSSACASSRPA